MVLHLFVMLGCVFGCFWRFDLFPDFDAAPKDPDISLVGTSPYVRNEKHGSAEARYDAFGSLKMACERQGKLLIYESLMYDEPECTWESEGLSVRCEVKASANCRPDPTYVDLSPKTVTKPLPKKPAPKPAVKPVKK